MQTLSGQLAGVRFAADPALAEEDVLGNKSLHFGSSPKGSLSYCLTNFAANFTRRTLAVLQGDSNLMFVGINQIELTGKGPLPEVGN